MVLAAGVAQAEVTFSGKAEFGASRTAKVAAVAAVPGMDASSTGTDSTTVAYKKTNYNATTYKLETVYLDTDNVVSATAPTADEIQVVRAAIATAKAAAAAHQLLMDADTTEAAYNAEKDLMTADLAEAARLEAQLAVMSGTAATAAVAAGDMVAYSGYDMNVAVSAALDNGMELSAAFDMGAGSIADRDDDRAMDAQAAAVALSSVTLKNGGVTYVVGQNKIDDLYDDTQNGDVSVSGAAGGVSYTLVTDLDKDTAAVVGGTFYNNAAANAAGADSLTTVAAVAAVYESTSMKLSGAAGGVDWTFTTTNKNDRGNAASKLSLGYAAGDALSFTLTHDTQGKREAINTLKASYTMDAITLTASMADDKNHVGNTNTSGKASQNLTIAYANGPLTASFNNDESSKWWATTAYDLGGGADIFATVDSTEFAVVGLSFNF